MQGSSACIEEWHVCMRGGTHTYKPPREEQPSCQAAWWHCQAGGKAPVAEDEVQMDRLLLCQLRINKREVGRLYAQRAVSTEGAP